MVDVTGKVGCRFGWRGKLIVQVEYRSHCYPPGSDASLEWKDATVNELVAALRKSGLKLGAEFST